MGKITDPTQPYFGQGLWTWDGSQWRRQPLLFGYSGLAGEDLEDTNLNAGTNTLYSSGVTSGYIEVVTQVAFRYTGTPPSWIVALTVGTLGTPVVLAEYTITSARWYYAQVYVVLAAADYLQCVVQGATAGDTLKFRYSGFKMSIQE